MKQLFLIVSFCLIGVGLQAQQEFHVTLNGSSSGDGTLQNPWDLQTALSQKSSVVNGGDTIWLHEGVYNGRFLSTLQSDIDNAYITVAPYQNGAVILNGNVNSQREATLNVTSKQVIFRDLEIAWLGDFSRNENDKNFRKGAGISHTSGEDCRFYNLDIHDNPGLGIGSWKSTGGTIIENCRIYYNGFTAKDGKGRGEGIYVQNKSEKIRLIQNNIIFANYYKGIEVWSAGRHADFEFVKNITIQNNVIFNSGLPTGNSYDNLIVATDDRNGVNRAKNIQVFNNVFYHNTDYQKLEVNGNAPSLTIGYIDNSPAENILIKGNIILGRNNALRLLHVKSMTFTDNTIYGGYVIFNANEMSYSKDWNFTDNTYFTKRTGAYRIIQDKTYILKDWQTTFKLDKDSRWNHIKDFDLNNVLNISEYSQRSNSYKVVLFNKEGRDVSVEFSQYKIQKGSSYRIYDVENPKKVLASGILEGSKTINFPMNGNPLENPLHNDTYPKSLSNFGVFLIEFDSAKISSKEETSGFRKFLEWLGF